jgi:DNA topoisomerase-1
MQILNKGWIEVYPLKFKEIELADLNGSFTVKKVNIEEKMTQPPKRYTPASIISELEKKNLGTKATRASVIETLYDRGYIKGQSIEATPLGISLISTLEKNSPIIIDEKLTRHFEKEMDSIQLAHENEENLEKKENRIINEAKQAIIKISQDFKNKEEAIGKELVEAQEQHWKNEKKENTLSICPKCGKGNLRILYNRAAKRSFIACSAYPECRTTFSLPPNGLIKPAGKNCESCGFPKLLSIRKGKRPWEFCFNPACETRKQNSENKKA